MTTRAHFADGSSFDVDEETEALFTHLNGQKVDRWEFTGPTPEGLVRSEDGSKLVPKSKPAPAVDPAVRRAELQAELDALGA